MSGAIEQFSFGTLDPNTTSGVELASYLTDFQAAVQQNNIGPSEPAYTLEGSIWVNNGTANQAVLNYTPAHGVSIPLFNINYSTQEAFPATNGIALVNGNSTEVFQAAPATGASDAVPLGQAQSLFTNNGQNGGNVSYVGSSPYNVAATQSGQVIAVGIGGATINLPPAAWGLNYTIYGTSLGITTVVVNGSVSVMVLPDGSTSGTMEIGAEQAGGFKLFCDGANWRCVPFDIPVVPQNTIANRAIPYAQIQSMIAAAATPGFYASWADSGVQAFSGDNNQNTITTSLTTPQNLGGTVIIVATKSQEQPGNIYTGMNLVVEIGGNTVFGDAQALGNSATMHWGGSVGANTSVVATLNAQSQYPYLGQVTILFLPTT